MSFVPRKLLVTGGAGFIGANFVRHWLRSVPGDGRLVAYDALTYAGNRDNLAGLESDPRFRFVQGDICDEAAVGGALEEYAIDTIVHFAAESHVDRSILGPDDFIRTNVVGTHVLLKAAKARWLAGVHPAPHRFHHVSTDEVYGSLGPDDPPFHEGTPYAPNSPYSASKAGSDHLVRAYHETYGLATTISNCSNNYGPYQFPEKLIPLVLINILAGKPLPVYGDGLQIRDWLHVADHCAAIARVLAKGRAGEVYNIGGNAETTNLSIVHTLCALVDARFAADPALRAAYPDSPAAKGARSLDLVTHVRDRLGHDRRYAIDFRKAARELGYAPSRTIERGLSETIDWYLGQPAWWQALLGSDYAAWVARNYRH
ncbi:MAG TPA: dTDP-glucose 4,6-dehydratase [Steroidobacteraceae bacterium]|nr:dTDP-glucose 4,6-dehydratase [Steroidobacteraceae bacterium]